MKTIRVFVLTAPGATSERAPAIRVPYNSSDAFIDSRVALAHGKQDDGTPHEWAVYEEEEAAPAAEEEAAQ